MLSKFFLETEKYLYLLNWFMWHLNNFPIITIWYPCTKSNCLLLIWIVMGKLKYQTTIWLFETECSHSLEDVTPVYIQGNCPCRMGKFRKSLTINNTCQEKHGVLYISRLQSVSNCQE